MKPARYFALVAAGIAVLAGCAGNESGAPGETVLIGIADQGADTKTTMQSGSVNWTSGDKLRIFDASGSNSETYTIAAEDDGAGIGHFSGNTLASGARYAVYPDAFAQSCSSGTVSITLPSVQKYAAASFATGANPSVANVADGRMHFYNLCGLVSVNLTGSATVSRIELKTLKDEALWGNAEVSMQFSAGGPAISMTGNMSEDRKTLTLDCGEGVALSSEKTAFFFVVPAGALASGFSIKVFDAEGSAMLKQTEKSELVAERSVWKNMNAIEYTPTESAFLSQSTYGVYDISNGGARALKTYLKGTDQIALRTSESSFTFRIQSLQTKTAVCVTVPSGMEQGGSARISVSSIGETGVSDASADMVLQKSEGGKLWIADKAHEIGYIIAGEI